MRKTIEKFYDWLFANKENDEVVPFANKRFMFWFSIISFAVVLFFIIKDVVRNIQNVQ
ncbi:hypothetical protein [Marivirga harenae]|uniref:hypothetical protein n=1 Tax=Marivirga harenae TaxID=2010992 RepID=UPI0026DFFC01|nr:hypothetical protein [Marivirga harenae]WKV10690.1 hypothetical protein Q3Y49_10745 [Marivirga harenae]|tara:strand:- start:71040 stop:71213 length:174 start_codon:yes stop_codon:yes gene_type:complete